MNLPQISFFIIISFFYSCVNTIEKEEHKDQIEIIIDKYKKTIPQNGQLSVCIIKNDTAKFYGFKKQDSLLIKINNQDSVFGIGSISKVFTSTLLSQKIKSNELKLSSRIQDFFDFKIKTGGEITLEMLSNHTSGLPRLSKDMMKSAFLSPENPYKNYKEENLINYLKNTIELDTSMGSEYAYSNLGVEILGYIISEKKITNYEELLQKLIFKPYNMTSSSTNTNNLKEKLVQGIKINGKPTTKWEFGLTGSAGAVMSTANDLMKFVKANFKQDSILELQRKPTFKVSNEMEMALGWHLFKKNNKEFYFHNGAVGGYVSSLFMDVKNKNAVIVLSNIDGFIILDEIAEKLFNSLY